MGALKLLLCITLCFASKPKLADNTRTVNPKNDFQLLTEVFQKGLPELFDTNIAQKLDERFAGTGDVKLLSASCDSALQALEGNQDFGECFQKFDQFGQMTEAEVEAFAETACEPYGCITTIQDAIDSIYDNCDDEELADMIEGMRGLEIFSAVACITDSDDKLCLTDIQKFISMSDDGGGDNCDEDGNCDGDNGGGPPPFFDGCEQYVVEGEDDFNLDMMECMLQNMCMECVIMFIETITAIEPCMAGQWVMYDLMCVKDGDTLCYVELARALDEGMEVMREDYENDQGNNQGENEGGDDFFGELWNPMVEHVLDAMCGNQCAVKLEDKFYRFFELLEGGIDCGGGGGDCFSNDECSEDEYCDEWGECMDCEYCYWDCNAMDGECPDYCLDYGQPDMNCYCDDDDFYEHPYDCCARCDGEVDCPGDHSDELYCGCYDHEECQAEEYCDAHGQCYDCEYCGTWCDGMGGECPQKCDAYAATCYCDDGVNTYDCCDSCDGNSNCNDGSDEAYCYCEDHDECSEGFYCSEYYHCDMCEHCHYSCDAIDGECLPTCPLDPNDSIQCSDDSYVSYCGSCDGVMDCLDQTDEHHCDCRRHENCLDTEYCTWYGQCDICEKCHSDCDPYDYGNCPDHCPEPAEPQCYCDDGTAVGCCSNCDGVSDCADNSDELECSCNFDDECGEGLYCNVYNYCNECDVCHEDCDGIEGSCDNCPDPVTPFCQCADGDYFDCCARCDGNDDCVDKTDEKECHCEANGDCLADEYCTGMSQCAACAGCHMFCDAFDRECPDYCAEPQDGECMCADGSAVQCCRFCDGNLDCADDSDEFCACDEHMDCGVGTYCSATNTCRSCDFCLTDDDSADGSCGYCYGPSCTSHDECTDGYCAEDPNDASIAFCFPHCSECDQDQQYPGFGGTCPDCQVCAAHADCDVGYCFTYNTTGVNNDCAPWCDTCQMTLDADGVTDGVGGACPDECHDCASHDDCAWGAYCYEYSLDGMVDSTACSYGCEECELNADSVGGTTCPPCIDDDMLCQSHAECGDGYCNVAGECDPFCFNCFDAFDGIDSTCPGCTVSECEVHEDCTGYCSTSPFPDVNMCSPYCTECFFLDNSFDDECPEWCYANVYRYCESHDQCSGGYCFEDDYENTDCRFKCSDCETLGDSFDDECPVCQCEDGIMCQDGNNCFDYDQECDNIYDCDYGEDEWCEWGCDVTDEDCFEGDDNRGACETCGWDRERYDDCLTCEDGYEVDVWYEDCAGPCVETGTAINPASDAECHNPCIGYESCSMQAGPDEDCWVNGDGDCECDDYGDGGGDSVDVFSAIFIILLLEPLCVSDPDPSRKYCVQMFEHPVFQDIDTECEEGPNDETCPASCVTQMEKMKDEFGCCMGWFVNLFDELDFMGDGGDGGDGDGGGGGNNDNNSGPSSEALTYWIEDVCMVPLPNMCGLDAIVEIHLEIPYDNLAWDFYEENKEEIDAAIEADVCESLGLHKRHCKVVSATPIGSADKKLLAEGDEGTNIEVQVNAPEEQADDVKEVIDKIVEGEEPIISDNLQAAVEEAPNSDEALVDPDEDIGPDAENMGVVIGEDDGDDDDISTGKIWFVSVFGILAGVSAALMV